MYQKGDNQQRHQTTLFEPVNLAKDVRIAGKNQDSRNTKGMDVESVDASQIVVTESDFPLVSQLRGGELLIVNSRRRNGLILFKRYYAEFAGPGSMVGGFFDTDCQMAIPVGDLSLLPPNSDEERQKAYLIRRQWIRLTEKLTENAAPNHRVQLILNQFENYFDSETVAQVPDTAFALLVGVLPQTVYHVRQGLLHR